MTPLQITDMVSSLGAEQRAITGRLHDMQSTECSAYNFIR
jgi:hypothetical protein